MELGGAMNREMKRKAVFMIAVGMSFLILLGAPLLFMQTNLSLAN